MPNDTRVKKVRQAFRASNKTSPAAFPDEQEARPGERVIAQARWM